MPYLCFMIRRSIYSALESHLTAKQITVLIGARQVGKTTLVKKLLQTVQERGGNTLYLNLDIEGDMRYLESQEGLLQKIRLETGESPATIFIDEIQRKENAGRFLKGLYDQDLPYKFVITGSGSMDLKASVSESLAGRKRVFPITPISFEEFFHYRTDYQYEGKELAYAAVETEKLDLLLLEYLSFGGYPAVILAPSIIEKRQVIQELFNAYIERDIVGLLNVNNRNAFILLLRLLADRQGSPINFTGLANETNISTATLKRYLHYASETFIIEVVSPYFNNVGKELVKASQYYYADPGLKNYALGQFTLLTSSDTRLGFNFEQFVHGILRKKCSELGWLLQYWRTRDGAEVDFVVNRITEVYPIEVKSRQRATESIPRSLAAFADKYPVKQAIVVSRSEHERKIAQRGVQFLFIPWWHLLFAEVFEV